MLARRPCRHSPPNPQRARARLTSIVVRPERRPLMCERQPLRLVHHTDHDDATRTFVYSTALLHGVVWPGAFCRNDAACRVYRRVTVATRSPARSLTRATHEQRAHTSSCARVTLATRRVATRSRCQPATRPTIRSSCTTRDQPASQSHDYKPHQPSRAAKTGDDRESDECKRRAAACRRARAISRRRSDLAAAATMVVEQPTNGGDQKSRPSRRAPRKG